MALASDPLSLLFYYRSLMDEDARQSERLGRILGTFWDADAIHSMAGTHSKQESKVAPKHVIIPLSVLLARHDFVKELAKRVPPPGHDSTFPVVAGAPYRPKPGENFRSMGNAPLEEFKTMLQRSGIYPGWQRKKAPSPSVATPPPPPSDDQLIRESPISQVSWDQWEHQMLKSGAIRPLPRLQPDGDEEP